MQVGSMQSLQVCRIRATRLNVDGTIMRGSPTGQYITGSAITVGVAFDYQEGVELTQVNGCGTICAFAKIPDILKKLNITMELCNLDSELIEVLTTTSVITSGGFTIGHLLPRQGACTIVPHNGVALELWTNRWNGCAPPSGGTGVAYGPYWRFVFPKVILEHGDITLENGFLRVPLKGFAVENPNFLDGPDNDMPGGSLPSVGAVFADTSIPAATNSYIAT